MTVTAEVPYIEYTANGATFDFVIPFSFLNDSTFIHVYNSTTGIATKVQYTQGVDYTVTGIGSSPKVHFAVAPVDTTKVLVRREVPFTQLVDFKETGVQSQEAIERALDKITMAGADLAYIIGIGDVDVTNLYTIDPNFNKFSQHFGPIGAPANGTYIWELDEVCAFTLDKISVITTAGTCSVAIKINGVNVVFAGGGTTVAASNVKAKVLTQSSFSAGSTAKVELIVSANAGSANLSASIECTRTG